MRYNPGNMTRLGAVTAAVLTPFTVPGNANANTPAQVMYHDGGVLSHRIFSLYKHNPQYRLDAVTTTYPNDKPSPPTERFGIFIPTNTAKHAAFYMLRTSVLLDADGNALSRRPQQLDVEVVGTDSPVGTTDPNSARRDNYGFHMNNFPGYPGRWLGFVSYLENDNPLTVFQAEVDVNEPNSLPGARYSTMQWKTMYRGAKHVINAAERSATAREFYQHPPALHPLQ